MCMFLEGVDWGGGGVGVGGVYNTTNVRRQKTFFYNYGNHMKSFTLYVDYLLWVFDKLHAFRGK